MRNSYHKSRRLAICLSILCMAGIYPATAQNEQAKYLAYLQVFKKKISDADISYKYTFSLFSESGRNDRMEVKGMLFKAGKSYLDSSSAGLSLLSGGYFFSARNNEKEAYVYSMKSLEQSMGMKGFGNSNPVVDIPDSLLLKNGTFSMGAASGEVMDLRYVYTGKDSPLQEVSMKIRKADTGLVEMQLVLRDNGYKKRMTLYGFKNDFDKTVLDASRYFTLSGKKVTLSNRFRSFKVNALL